MSISPLPMVTFSTKASMTFRLSSEAIVGHYEPQVLVMEDGVGRSARIRALVRQITALARKRGVRIGVLSREEVRRVFFPEGPGSKDALAAILAERFSEELGRHLPRYKRKDRTSEDHRIPMFMAAALGLAFGSQRRSEQRRQGGGGEEPR